MDQAMIGDAFPAGDPQAQWVAVLCIALSDLGTVDAHLHDAIESNDESSSSQQMRWLCSFLHELALHIRHGHKQERVAALLDRLDDDAKRAETLITSLDAELGPARGGTFHYPKVSSQAILDGLRAVASRPAFLLRDSEAQTLRVGFADVIAEGVAFGDIENDPEAFRALVTRVHAAVKALSSYVGAVLRLYQADRDLHIIDP